MVGAAQWRGGAELERGGEVAGGEKELLSCGGWWAIRLWIRQPSGPENGGLLARCLGNNNL